MVESSKRRNFPFDQPADVDDDQYPGCLHDQHRLHSQQSKSFLTFSQAHQQQLVLRHLRQHQDKLLCPRLLAGDGDDEDQKQNQRKHLIGEMHELADFLSKLNPVAKEFFPPSSETETNDSMDKFKNRKVLQQRSNSADSGKKPLSSRAIKAQQDDCIRRTIYVSDIDHQVTEEQLAALFISCGQVVDCRVCGDPNSILRFAFVEFTDEDGAREALSLSGTMLGYYPVRILPSKTAIVPVNPYFLPWSEDELEMCARTVYCTNIDKRVYQIGIKFFFETLCGKVARLRLLGEDYQHATRIAFVEFAMAESAMAALNCSGAILGSLPIRVSPSKTPVRPPSPRVFRKI